MNMVSGKIMLLKVFPNFSMQKKPPRQRQTLLTGVKSREWLQAAALLVLEVQVWTVKCDEQRGMRARLKPRSIKASKPKFWIRFWFLPLHQGAGGNRTCAKGFSEGFGKRGMLQLFSASRSGTRHAYPYGIAWWWDRHSRSPARAIAR